MFNLYAYGCNLLLFNLLQFQAQSEEYQQGISRQVLQVLQLLIPLGWS